MALKELKKEMRHCAVSPLIFLWREYLSYKVFPERKLGQQPCDEVAQCEGTEGQRQDEPRCAQFHGLQYAEKDGVFFCFSADAEHTQGKSQVFFFNV